MSKCAALASILLLGGIGAAPVLGQGLYGAGQPYGGPIASNPGMAMGMAGPSLYGGAVNPYMAMGAGLGAAAANPYGAYNPISAGSGYNPFMYPYYPIQNDYGGIFGRVGGALYGASQVISAYGQAINAQEQARIMREQYYQQKLETQRRAFDLQMYIAARTPSFSEVQANNARNTLRRIQNGAAPAEIASGKALNLLLDDAAKFGGKRPALDAITLAPDTLKQLNVSKQGTGIGVLRNDGKIAFPVALAELLTQEQRKAMTLQAQLVVKDAAKGNLDPNVFKDLRNEINTTRDQLLRRVNDMPGEQYLQAKRFLTDLESALQAVQQGEVKVQADFDNFVAGKSRSVQDVVDFMAGNGYRFAPSALGDEAAYRALYSALANYDVALNSQYNVAPPKEEAP